MEYDARCRVYLIQCMRVLKANYMLILTVPRALHLTIWHFLSTFKRISVTTRLRILIRRRTDRGNRSDLIETKRLVGGAINAITSTHNIKYFYFAIDINYKWNYINEIILVIMSRYSFIKVFSDWVIVIFLETSYWRT